MEFLKFDKQVDRWNHIDLIEFLGMMFVLIFHATTYSYSWMEDGSALSLLRYFFRTILSTCVPLFFFANGYLLLNRGFDLKKHIVKTIKIVILTCVWEIIDLLLLMLIKNEYLSFREFMGYLRTWYDPWIGHLWYMGALVCIYIFFPLIKTAFDNDKKIFIYFTIACAILTFGNKLICDCGSIILNAIGLYDGMLSIKWFKMFNPFRGIYGYSFVYFCVGGLAHGAIGKLKEIPLKKRNITAMVVIVLSCIGLFITGILLSNISGKIWYVVWSGYDTIFTFVNVCMIFILSLAYSGHSKIIRLVSLNTLGIYYMHMLFIHSTKEFVKTIPVARSFVGCVVYALLVMFICLALTQLFIRIPLIKRLIKL